MSLCDTCSKPGSCCNDFALNGADGSITVWAAVDWRAEAKARLASRLPGAPFIPLRLELVPPEKRDPAANADYGVVRWTCKNITPEGRCADYENRPQLCRDYEAGSDKLCAMHVPAATDGEGSAHAA